MTKLGIVIVLLLILVLAVGAVGCGSSEREEIISFLRDDHTIDVLLEHDDKMAAANHVFNTTYLRGDACSLLERAVEGRDEILDTEPPEALHDFWVQIILSAEYSYSSLDEFCRRGWTYMVIDDWNLAIETSDNAYSTLDEVLIEYDVDPASIYSD